MPLFDVHLYPIVHVSVAAVEAANPEDAVKKALEECDLYKVLDTSGRFGSEYTAWAEDWGEDAALVEPYPEGAEEPDGDLCPELWVPLPLGDAQLPEKITSQGEIAV